MLSALDFVFNLSMASRTPAEWSVSSISSNSTAGMIDLLKANALPKSIVAVD